MYLAGSDGIPQQPQKRDTKCNVRELLSKFETYPTLVQHNLDGQSSSTAAGHRFSFSGQDTVENLNVNFVSVTSTFTRKPESHSVTSSDTKLSQAFLSVSPDMSQKDSSFSLITPKLSQLSDPNPHASPSSPLPPCVRARLAKAARNKLANSTALSVSLDEGQFLSSSSEDAGHLVRVQTSPDINDTREHGDVLVDNDCEKHKISSEMSVLPVEKTSFIAPLGLDDPQRRERIERYKEERRLFLREKYSSESFRGERDEMLQRLKQKAGKAVSSPTDEPMEMCRSFVTGSDQVQSNSFQSAGHEKEGDVKTPSLPGSERLSGTLERTRERRFGRRSVSPKDKDSEIAGKQICEHVSSPEHFEKQSKCGSDGGENAHHRFSSKNDKRKFSSSSTSPERPPISCVTVRQRLGSDRMIVSMESTSDSLTNDPDRPTSRSSGRNQLEKNSKPSVIRTSKGHAVETKRQFSDSEIERVPLRTAPAGERLTKSDDNYTMQRRSTDRFHSSQEHPSVEIRLCLRGECVYVGRMVVLTLHCFVNLKTTEICCYAFWDLLGIMMMPKLVITLQICY